MSKFINEAVFKEDVRYVVRKTVRENHQQVQDLDKLRDLIISEVMRETSAAACSVVFRDPENPRKLRCVATKVYWVECPNRCKKLIEMQKKHSAWESPLSRASQRLSRGCSLCNEDGDMMQMIETGTNITVPSPKPMFGEEFDFST